jgi:hypothetical protein
MAYSFEMMEDRFSAAFFRRTIEDFFRLRPRLALLGLLQPRRAAPRLPLGRHAADPDASPASAPCCS